MEREVKTNEKGDKEWFKKDKKGIERGEVMGSKMKEEKKENAKKLEGIGEKSKRY